MGKTLDSKAKENIDSSDSAGNKETLFDVLNVCVSAFIPLLSKSLTPVCHHIRGVQMMRRCSKVRIL